MFRRAALTVAFMAAIAAPAVADDATRWINVDVTEHSGDADVKVRVPLSLVLVALDVIETEEIDDGQLTLTIDDTDIDWIRLLEGVRDAPDGEFVTVQSRDADVRVVKRGGSILIHVDEHDGEGAEIDVHLPAELMSSVHIENDRLDLKRLLSSLAVDQHGDLVRVKSADADVRVWID